MKTIRLALLALCALAAFVIPGRSDTYTGTISYQLTSLDGGPNGVDLNTVYTGSYSYQSDTGPDGEFDNYHLSGGINVPLWMGGYVNFPGHGIYLTVTNDVPHFMWTCDNGALSFGINHGTFGFACNGISGGGTVAIGAPIDTTTVSLDSFAAPDSGLPSDPPTSGVPDTGTTALLLALTCATLGLIHRFHEKANHAS